ncbi:MAG: dolichyl-phosphate beta-glucosyltransferase [bacterium]
MDIPGNIFLSVIIPAYNEEKRLPKTLRIVNDYLKQQSYNYEILVISDGSKDKTVEEAEKMSLEIPNLRVIGNKENHGKGYVIRQAMLEADGDYRVFTDADNSTSIDHVAKIIPEFKNGFSVVIGTRDSKDHKDAKQAFSQPLHRRFLGDIINLFVQFILGLYGFWDTQCGFKAYTKEAAQRIFSKCVIDRFAFDPETLVLAKKLGYKIKKVPVYWINDAASTVHFSSGIKMIIDLLRIRLNMLTGKY